MSSRTAGSRMGLGVNADTDFGALVGPAATFGVDVHITAIIDDDGGSFTVAGTKNADRFVNEAGNNASGIYEGRGGNDIFIADNSGGLDVYRGGIGNDLFDLDGDFGLNGVQVSSIDGGIGIDTIEAGNTSLLGHRNPRGRGAQGIAHLSDRCADRAVRYFQKCRRPFSSWSVRAVIITSSDGPRTAYRLTARKRHPGEIMCSARPMIAGSVASSMMRPCREEPGTTRSLSHGLTLPLRVTR